jgi:hypothetical protein
LANYQEITTKPHIAKNAATNTIFIDVQAKKKLHIYGLH